MNTKFTSIIVPIILFVLLTSSLGLYFVKSSQSKVAPAPTPAVIITPTLKPLPTLAGNKTAEELTAAARSDLAERLDISQTEITTRSVQSIVWNDASLGCPGPGMLYAQVLTPGFRIMLAAEGKQYSYHTNFQFPKLCPNPK